MSTVDELNKNDVFCWVLFSKFDISEEIIVMQLRRDVILWIFWEFAESDQEAAEENSIFIASWCSLRGLQLFIATTKYQVRCYFALFLTQIRN